jgi:hypothetical protein
MSLYGITDAKQLALEFDGERVGDGQTPQGLGIEDDDLIEVKVSERLYGCALQRACYAWCASVIARACAAPRCKTASYLSCICARTSVYCIVVVPFV